MMISRLRISNQNIVLHNVNFFKKNIMLQYYLASAMKWA
jgi:hypothetical protein